MVAAPEIPTTKTKAPGTADMDWENLGFEYRDGEHMMYAYGRTASSSGIYVSCVVPVVRLAMLTTCCCCYRGMAWCYGEALSTVSLEFVASSALISPTRTGTLRTITIVFQNPQSTAT